YLTNSYFDVYATAVSKAKELGMNLCIYDEYGFPSGSAGASNGDGIPRFANAFPNDTIKRLDKSEQTITGPVAYQRTLPAGAVMACVAMNTATKERVDVSAGINGTTLVWNAPAGNWKVMIFVCVKDGDPNVDYLDPEACDKYIQMTHQPYFDRFGADFGKEKTIDGVFFDETTMYRANGRMWTGKFNEKFQAKYGFNPATIYPALWYDIGTDTQAARNHLFGLRAELYADGYAKRVQDWCRSQGDIPATGHQDQEEIVNPCNVSGDLMKCFRGQDVPGIDKIGGNRPAEKFYKIVSSAANNYDKENVMSETYGDMGNISYDTMYHVLLDQYTKGVNTIIPHAVWYNNSSVTFLPELSWRNPLYASGLAAYNQAAGRMNVLLQGKARHVADIALLYPMATLQGGNVLDGPLGYYEGGIAIPEADYVDVSVILSDTLNRDFTFIHPEILDEKISVEGARLDMENTMNREQFKVFIMPGQTTISWSNLQKIKQFYDNGGKVIATKSLPSKSAEFGHDSDVVQVIGEMFPTASSYPIATASSSWASGGYGANLANDASLDTRWNAADGTSGNQWLEIDFGSPKTFNKTIIKEAFARITSYQIQYWNGTTWVSCATGTTAGVLKTDTFAEITASKVRLYINSISADSVSIHEFEVYQGTGPNLATNSVPVMHQNANGGKTYFVSSANSINMRSALDDALAVYDVEVEDGKRLQYIHKIKDGKGIYMFGNLSGAAVDTYVRLRGKLTPQLWNPHTGVIITTPEFTHVTEDGQAVTRVRITLDNLRSTFVVANLGDAINLEAAIEVSDDLISLTMKNLIRDRRYLVSKSDDLENWKDHQDFIATGLSDPQASSADIVTMVLVEPKIDPKAFFRVSSVD
ncbi:MAG: hypothetical protein EOP85_03190, partial [Verrucomicrobiaceae bacterium]